MSNKTVIFIGGPSGSGKTTCSVELSKNLPNSEKFRFCKVMDREAERFCLSKTERLQQWYHLQVLLAKNLVLPKLNENKTLIFDLHYSQPLSDDPEIVFPRRTVSLKHDFRMRLGNEFLRMLTEVNVPLFLFFLTADEATLKSRLINDSIRDQRDYMSSLEMIRKEKSAELESYKKTIQTLNGLGLKVEPMEIENVENANEKTVQTMLRILKSGSSRTNSPKR